MDQKVRREVHIPAEDGLAPVGHLGFFRSANAAPLWKPALDRLVDTAG